MMARKRASVQLSKELVIDLYEAALRFRELVETLEIQLDSDTIRRIKRGEKEYRQGKFKIASDRGEIDRILSA